MKFEVECVQCLTRQLVDAARVIYSDSADQTALVQDALGFLSTLSVERTPPAVIHDLCAYLEMRSGVKDPYRQIKTSFNRYVLRNYDMLESEIHRSDDPLQAALLLSIVGNMIDMAVVSSVDTDDILQAVRIARDKTLPKETLRSFRRDVERAGSILYLGDNSGEIVFDKLLIHQLPREKITYVVRGKPVLNDATLQDARDTGMTDLVRVVDNGAGAPGTVLELCSPEFLEMFDKADCVVSKGMGNVETLFESPKNIYFVLQAKCAVLARFLEVPVGEFLFFNRSTGSKVSR